MFSVLGIGVIFSDFKHIFRHHLCLHAGIEERQGNMVKGKRKDVQLLFPTGIHIADDSQ